LGHYEESAAADCVMKPSETMSCQLIVSLEMG